MFLNNWAEARNQAASKVLRCTPGNGILVPPQDAGVFAAGRPRPSPDLTLLASWLQTTPDFKTDVLCSCGLNLK